MSGPPRRGLAVDVAKIAMGVSFTFNVNHGNARIPITPVFPDMAALQRLSKLSEAHCVLLAVQYATESNLTALRALTALRDGDLPLELTLSILLNYLPEEKDPSSYCEYLQELANGSRYPGESPAESLDLESVEQLSNSRAKKKRHALDLTPVVHPLYAAASEVDIFTHFLIHRAHRIDAQTGLLDLVPKLIVPFLGHSEYLRTWFISTVLPLLRLSYEYYPQSDASSLDEFAALKGQRAIDYQLSHMRNASGMDIQHAARDLKGVVAPWLCGANERKRRRTISEGRRASIAQDEARKTDDWDYLFIATLDWNSLVSCMYVSHNESSYSMCTQQAQP